MKLSKTMMINEKLLPASKKAFTLAEVLITLSILGVVAALTIPTLVNRQSDLAAQTRIKKAISSYEDMAAIFMAENDAADLKTLACENLGEYFKTVTINGCQFTAADGTVWVFGNNAAAAAQAAANGQPAVAANAGNQGNVVVYDSANSPRYAVVMWSKAGEANGRGNNNAGASRTPVAQEIPAAPNGIATPLHGFFDATRFLNSTSAQLQAAQAGNNAAPTDVLAAADDDGE